MTKKIEPERFAKWIKDPVTRVYLEAVKDYNNELAGQCASGSCIGQKDSTTTVSERYYEYMGMLKSAQVCYGAENLLFTYGYLGGDDEKDPE